MNQSVATHQFPQIVWRDGKKHLWNPIQRKALKNRPEERVRLRVIEYLVEGGWSRHRISAEEALKSRKDSPSLRTDLICYTQQFDPFLLVECKAEQITINEATATQIARYNQNIKAPFLLMTNGVNDFWYEINPQQKVQSLDQIPTKLPILKEPENKPLAYWKERGFAGKNARPKLRKWLEKILNLYLIQPAHPKRFLSFSNSPSDLDLNNYYTLYTYSNHKIALTFTATPFGGNRLICIINQEGQNKGVLEINLDLLFDDRQPNTSVYSSEGTKNIDLRNEVDWNFSPANFNTIVDQISTLLAKHTL